MNRLVVVAIACTIGGRAAGADSPPVRLHIEDCVGVDADAVARIVEMEIRTSLMDGESPPSSDTTRVEVSCDGPLLVLRAVDPITGKQSSRRIDMASTSPLARERTLGLSIVELVVASWSELAIVPEPAAPIVERTSSPNARGAARARVRDRIRADGDRARGPNVALFARTVRTSAGNAIGVGAVLRVNNSERFGWGVELATHHARVNRQRGRVDIDFPGVAAWADAHGDWRGLRGRAGIGLRVEWVRMVGDANNGAVTVADSFSAVGGGPSCVGSVGVDVNDVTFEIGAELTYRLLATRGRVTNDRDVELNGVSASASIAAGWRW